ncbi:MAG: putative PEP-binding protein, partial [Anaerolineales bacterium]
EAGEEVVRSGGLVSDDIQIGIMVEVPSVVVMADQFASQVDFFSIGTNDLTQYTMAAERGNPSLREYSDALHPAILMEIEKVVSAAHATGKWAAVCGEIASDAIAVPVLVGLGVDELSLVPSEIPYIKSIIRSLRYEDARALAQEALACATALEVRQLAKAFFQNLTPVKVDS